VAGQIDACGLYAGHRRDRMPRAKYSDGSFEPPFAASSASFPRFTKRPRESRAEPATAVVSVAARGFDDAAARCGPAV
jgi:hypothetical protein